jgi:hypothetical protein
MAKISATSLLIVVKENTVVAVAAEAVSAVIVSHWNKTE